MMQKQGRKREGGEIKVGEKGKMDEADGGCCMGVDRCSKKKQSRDKGEIRLVTKIRGE